MTVIASAVTDLGSIAGGGQSVAYKINDHGVVVGFAVDSNEIDQAVVWQDGAMTVLPDHQSNGHSAAYDINDAGIIVGHSDVYTVSTGWQEDAVMWQNGLLIDLNTLLPNNSGWVLNVAHGINDNGEIAGTGTYNGVATAFVLSIGDSSGPMMSAAAAVQSFQTTPHGAALSVSDTAANIQSDFDSLEALTAVGKLLQVQVSDSATASLTLNAGQLISDASVLADLPGSAHVHVAQETINDAYAALTESHVTAVGIMDSAFSVASSLDQLQAWAVAGQLTGISLTNGGDPALSLSAQQTVDDGLALKAIQGDYQLSIYDATVAQALALNAEYSLGALNIADSIDTAASAASQLNTLNGRYSLNLSGTVSDLAAHFDILAGLSHAGSVSVTVTDTDFPTLTITTAQDGANTSLVMGLGGDFLLEIDASHQFSGAIYGKPGGTILALPDPIAEYNFSTFGGSLELTDPQNGGTYILVNVTAVKFADETDFVVQAPSATGETSGNVAELYAAVLARTPDASGLAYYQQLLESGRGPSMLQLADYFLQSPEYANNPAHAYAQSAAGDAQFVTDTYQNLLHRAPDSGAVSFYQNVLTQFTAGLAPGTPAYAAAQMQGHAQVLVYFSASSEFLNDVQITAQHPADAQHWLYVL